MNLVQIPYALTTVDKVNASLGFTTGDDATRDQLIANMIAAQTDYIEGYCGGRRFEATDYTEIVDARPGNYVFGSQRPWNSLTKVEYRTGQPSNPTWVTYYVDGYLPYLGSGMIRFFSKFVPFPQAFRLTYNAGYLIDWTNENDPTLHTLPHDLSQVATELTSILYNQRLAQGIVSETTEGQSVSYGTDRQKLDNNHDQVLNKYKINRASIAV